MIGGLDCFSGKYGRQEDLINCFGLEVDDIIEVSMKNDCRPKKVLAV
jgi:hypothetical protein